MQLAQFDVAGKMFSMVIATIQIHATRVAFNWEIQMLILKFGFQILQSNTKSENGFHLWEIRPQGGFQVRNSNQDFLDFLFTIPLGNPKKDLQ